MADSGALARREPTVPNRPLDAGDIVAGSFRTLRAAPGLFLGVPLATGAALVLPFALALTLIVAGSATGTSTGNEGLVTMGVLLGVVIALAAIYVVVRVAAALTIGSYQVTLGERPKFGALWRAAGGAVWRLIGAVLLLYVAIVGSVLLFGGLIWAIASGSEGAAALIGILLLIAFFPAMIFFTVKLIYLLPVIALEQTGPINAMTRSWSLTRGFWWPTFGRYLLLGLLSLPISIIAQVVLPKSLVGNNSEIDWASASMGVILALCIYLVLYYIYSIYQMIYITIMYIDARRREGLPHERVAATPAGTYPYGAQPVQPYQGQNYPQGPPPPPPAAPAAPSGIQPYPPAAGQQYPQPPGYSQPPTSGPQYPQPPGYSQPPTSGPQYPQPPGYSQPPTSGPQYPPPPEPGQQIPPN